MKKELEIIAIKSQFALKLKLKLKKTTLVKPWVAIETHDKTNDTPK